MLVVSLTGLPVRVEEKNDTNAQSSLLLGMSLENLPYLSICMFGGITFMSHCGGRGRGAGRR